MKSFFTPAAESYLLDWGLTFAIGGALFVIIGFVSGWIIWRNARNFSQRVQERNRVAFAEYEKTSDEISRLKSELVGGDR
ncbi:MAG: hypothetical protein QE273_04680 [Verrucomicrobiales bacterium]|jgi:hypothetical protein|nr:hypothetical protein [Verrucomicrobiales bacterium]